MVIQSSKHIVGVIALLILVLAVSFVIYLPGIHGPFVLDDHVNLAALTDVPRQFAWPDVLSFLFSDTGHPGRYLGRLSFVLQRSEWPGNATAFKQINVLLHLLNSALLFWVLLLLFRETKSILRLHGSWVALLSVTLWLLHPLSVSTILYVVQRETILAGTCMLIGFALYLWGRHTAATDAIPGYASMSLGTVVGTVLGTFCKETALLFPLLLLVLELTLLAAIPRPRNWKLWMTVFLLPPLLFAFSWHIYNFEALHAGYGSRNFDMTDRVLTQGRVLMLYLGYVLFPTRSGTGLFHDDITISTSLLSPPVTIFAWSTIAGLLALAISIRKKAPMLSFGILWFFAGHLIESGIIPLELYFEHRNYVPMIGPLVALAYYGIAAVSHLRIAGTAALAGYLALLFYNTQHNIVVWNNQVSMALTWEIEHPKSPRALQFAADAWLKAGQIKQAESRIERILALRPASTGAAAQLVQLSCLDEERNPAVVLNRQRDLLLGHRLDKATLPTIEQTLVLIKDGRCTGLTVQHIQQLLDGLFNNSVSSHDIRLKAQVLLLKAKIYNIQQQPRNAAVALSDSFLLYPQYRVAVLESVAWWQASDLARALDAVERAKRYRCAKLGILCVQTDELKSWEERLRQEVQSVDKRT